MHLQLRPNSKGKEEYCLHSAKVIGKIMNRHNEKQSSKMNKKLNFLQTYNLRQGLHRFGEKGLKALQKRNEPIA